MTFKNSRKWFTVAVVAGLLTGFQGAAHAADSSSWLQSLFGGQDANNGQNAPDQKQIDADLVAATQLQQTYQNDRQALAQAYRSGDRQNIQNLQSAVNTDIAHLQTNGQDLAKDGVANPNSVPAQPAYPHNAGQSGGRWQNRAVNPGDQGQFHRQWDNGARHDRERDDRRHHQDNRVA